MMSKKQVIIAGAVRSYIFAIVMNVLQIAYRSIKYQQVTYPQNMTIYLHLQV